MGYRRYDNNKRRRLILKEKRSAIVVMVIDLSMGIVLLNAFFVMEKEKY